VVPGQAGVTGRIDKARARFLDLLNAYRRTTAVTRVEGDQADRADGADWRLAPEPRDTTTGGGEPGDAGEPAAADFAAGDGEDSGLARRGGGHG